MIKANLVFVRDSGLEYVEFRVQCEVRIRDQKEGVQIEAGMAGNDQALKAALELVKKSIDPKATERFRKIVTLAFEDQPGWTK